MDWGVPRKINIITVVNESGNKKVFLREHKRHTGRHVVSTRCAALSPREGAPHPAQWWGRGGATPNQLTRGTPIQPDGKGTPIQPIGGNPHVDRQTNACQITIFHRVSYAGGNKSDNCVVFKIALHAIYSDTTH